MPALSETRQNQITIALLAVMLSAFAIISFASARTKSATADEPLHWLAGFMKLHYADFRVDAEDPPLAFYWAMLPHPPDTLKPDLTSSTWNEMLRYPWSQWSWVGPTFFRTSGFDPDLHLNRSRAVMTLLGVMLGIVIAWWARSISGRVAAIIACGLYCFDPNFIGHAPLVKNDVPIALVLIALAFAVYRAGEQVTILRLIAIALLSAAALTTKFSGVLFVPIVVAMLIARALIARPWLVLGRIITARATQFGVACAMVVLCGIVSYAGIWAAYGFRYSMTQNPREHPNFDVILRAVARNQLLLERPDAVPYDDTIANRAKNMTGVPRAMLWINEHRLLPEAWTAGFLQTYASTMRRPAFLNGQRSWTGWWYYFPLAFLYKTPIATLATLVIALAMIRRGRRFDRWTACCLAIPFAIYGASALTTNLNLGLRHIIPIIPIMCIWAGATLANARAMFPRFVPMATAILGIGLLIETLAAAPNYIAFFNVAAGGPRGGIELLGDSNLDWGQDLTLLRAWQRANPDADLILDYFGGGDPSYYVKHTLLIDPAKTDVAPLPAAIGRDESGRRKVLAISASKLQVIYPPHSLIPFYEYVQKHEPLAVLGGTIYLYELPLRN
jgi:4-amino-4-deoxy-L-arabinose transferase-like glycosyltransferase